MIRPVVILLTVGLAISMVLATYPVKTGPCNTSTPPIIAGKYAKKGQFPFVASLQIHFDDGDVGTCGGAIIHEYFIATAAHCVMDSDVIHIFAFAGSNIKFQGTQYSVKRVFHNYYPDNELALLQTTTRIMFTPNVRPILLSNHYAGSGMKVRISGFGFTDRIDDRHRITKLKFVDMMIDAYNPRDPVYITAAVSKNGASPCKGDSGSPVTYRNYLIGLHESSNDCSSNSDARFVNVLFFVQWIQDTINQNNVHK